MAENIHMQRLFLILAICALALAPLRAYAMTAILHTDATPPCHQMNMGGSNAMDHELNDATESAMTCCDIENHNSCGDCAAAVALMSRIDTTTINMNHGLIPELSLTLSSTPPSALLRPPKAL